MTEQEALIEEWVIRTLNSSMHGFLMNREKHSASDNRSPPEDKILMRVDRFIDLLPELVQTIADAGQRGNNGELHADRVSPAEWTAIIRTRRDHDHDDTGHETKGIVLPDSVTNIGDRAFNGCNNLTIKCQSGSAAEKYAEDNYINYEITG